jgi:hypothetical protein
LGRREGLLALSEGVAKTDTTDRRTVVVWSILLGEGGSRVTRMTRMGDRWMMAKVTRVDDRWVFGCRC